MLLVWVVNWSMRIGKEGEGRRRLEDGGGRERGRRRCEGGG